MIECKLLLLWKDSFFPPQYLHHLPAGVSFQLEIHLLVIFSIGSSCWVVTQSVTYRFTHPWVALARIAVSKTCLCISSSASATVWLWASALSVIPTVIQSRMDFMAPTSSFNVTQLRASVAALSHPFWYSVLKVNLTSDCTQWCQVAFKLRVVMIWADCCQHWQWMVSRVGIPETALQLSTLLLNILVLLHDSYTHE